MMNEHVHQGAARLLFALAWADWVEQELGDDGPNLSGCDIFEVMPQRIPKRCELAAAHLLGKVEVLNEAADYTLLQRAARADMADPRYAERHQLEIENPELETTLDWYEIPEDYATRFGECLVYQALGHGVSWFDDHAKFELEVPTLAWHWCELDCEELDPEREYEHVWGAVEEEEGSDA